MMMITIMFSLDVCVFVRSRYDRGLQKVPQTEDNHCCISIGVNFECNLVALWRVW